MVPADVAVAMWHFLGGLPAQAAPHAAHICAACMEIALTVDRRR
jgi:hypothetical protein